MKLFKLNIEHMQSISVTNTKICIVANMPVFDILYVF
jgi:hypothetical protein